MAKSEVFLYILSSFIGGIALGSFFHIPPWLLITAAGLDLAVIAVIFMVRRTLVWFGIFFLILLAGILRYSLYTNPSEPDPHTLMGTPLSLTGIIIEDPIVSSNQKLTVRVESVNHQALPDPPLLLMAVRPYPHFRTGDRIRATGIIKKPEIFKGYDYPAALARKNIYILMTYPSIEKIGEQTSIAVLLSRVRHRFEENIEEVLPEPHAAFLKGLLLGERTTLPQNLVADFSTTGTTHIIALSGYNITILARFFVTVLAWLTVPFFISFWIAACAIVLFVLLAGASASLLRAACMGILVLLAQREGRMYSITNALVFTGALMLLQNPTLLRFDTAFQLSFLATIGLIFIAPMLETFLLRRSLFQKKSNNAGPWNGIRQIFIETVSAQLAVMPILIYVFGRTSLVSPLANILVLIAVPWAMGWGFLTGMLGFISSLLARIVAPVSFVLLSYILTTIELFAKVPGASVDLPAWSVVLLLSLYAVVFFKLKRRAKASVTLGKAVI